MQRLFSVMALQLCFLATGTGMALWRDDPLWLVFGAVLAIATGLVARNNSGS